MLRSAEVLEPRRLNWGSIVPGSVCMPTVRFCAAAGAASAQASRAAARRMVVSPRACPGIHARREDPVNVPP
jgi:hypothetical protein